MIKAKFDKDGFPTAFYDTRAYTDTSFIPDDTIEITEDQWQEFLNNAGRKKWLDGKIVDYTPPAPPVVYPNLSARQFWQTALTIGITEDGLVAAVSDTSSPYYIKDDKERESTLIDIKKATSFSRDFPLLKTIAKEKNISDDDLNKLWLEAAKIE